MLDAEQQARLRLARTEGIGPVGFARLVGRFGSGAAAVAALAAMGRPLADAAVVDAELADAARLGLRHVVFGGPGYPELLGELADPPPVLLLGGDPAVAARPVVAMVGARNASAAGRQLARALAEGLGAAGWVVASGLARGIDTAAHEGALASGTIACVAGGPDIAYPPENAGLQQAIGAAGLLISEMPPGTEPQARHFPRRNRLIAGIARGVVVVEAAAGSGSLITARLAADAGREVMAVPGHPLDPRSRGGNGLLKEGAVLVETVADVLAVLAPFAVAPVAGAPIRRKPAGVAPPARQQRSEARVPPVPVPGGEAVVLELLSVSGVAIDEVVRASGLSAADVQGMLSGLELDGRVVRLAGGRVALAS